LEVDVMRTRIAIAGAVIGTTAGITLGQVIRWQRTWGIDPIEAVRALPGDDLVPVPTAIDTRAITIDAPPEAVWPWLVQMGYGRAGWYSYDQLDNRGQSSGQLLPAWQRLEVGDIMPTHPDGGFEVRLVEPGRALALSLDSALIASQAAVASADRADVPAGLAASGIFLRQAPQDFDASWTFVLEPLDGGRTRLIERFRVRFGKSGPAFRVIAPAMGFGVFVMMRRQMLGLRDRAIRTAVVPAETTKPKATGRSISVANGHEMPATAIEGTLIASGR
jgi:hypothetical protein